MADPESITVIEVGPIMAKGPKGDPGTPGAPSNIPTYANKAALLAEVPSPANGQIAVLLDTYQYLVYRSAAPIGWFPPWNTSWGKLASVSLGASYALSGVYDLVTATFTAVPGRNIMAAVHMTYLVSAASAG